MPLSPLVRFDTSTWTYEGWKGDGYKREYRKGQFKQDSLAEYTAYEYQGERLFRIVGFDFTFYGPPTVRQLQHYTSLVPADFQACAKVWEEITFRSIPLAFATATRQVLILSSWVLVEYQFTAPSCCSGFSPHEIKSITMP